MTVNQRCSFSVIPDKAKSLGLCLLRLRTTVFSPENTWSLHRLSSPKAVSGLEGLTFAERGAVNNEAKCQFIPSM